MKTILTICITVVVCYLIFGKNVPLAAPIAKEASPIAQVPASTPVPETHEQLVDEECLALTPETLPAAAERFKFKVRITQHVGKDDLLVYGYYVAGKPGEHLSMSHRTSYLVAGYPNANIHPDDDELEFLGCMVATVKVPTTDGATSTVAKVVYAPTR